MTRVEAIAKCGIRAVSAAEALNCELTNRVGGNGPGCGDPFLEYSASVDVDVGGLTQDQADNLPLGGCSLAVYYQIDSDWIESLGEGVNFEDYAAWDITRYEIQ